MKLIAVSDIHGRHRKGLTLPPGDILIIAGDVGARTQDEAEEFVAWMGQQAHRHKMLVPGNWDRFLEDEPDQAAAICRDHGVILLNDSGTTIDGITFWGSPITPTFMSMAFNRAPGTEIERHWSMIPDRVDVLIVHGPPYGILDQTEPGKPHLGCPELLARVRAVKPKVFICGHIHGGYGRMEQEGTKFFNVSYCTEDDISTNPVTEIEF